jgi:hypothetical protein
VKRTVAAASVLAAGLLLAGCSSGGASPSSSSTPDAAACRAELHRLFDQYSQDSSTPLAMTSAPMQCQGISSADLTKIVDDIVASAFASAFPEASPS